MTVILSTLILTLLNISTLLNSFFSLLPRHTSPLSPFFPPQTSGFRGGKGAMPPPLFFDKGGRGKEGERERERERVMERERERV